MRNFNRLGTGLDFSDLLRQITMQPELWNQHKFRTTYKGTPHVDVDDIWLRFSDISKVQNPDDVAQVVEDTSASWYPAAQRLPAAKLIVLNVMRATEAYQLDRLLVTRIKPGGQILKHADADGAYVRQHNIVRYHAVLQGKPGSMFGCGEEEVNMQTGEVWWFNPYDVHWVKNNSDDDRIHLLIDVRLWP